MHDRQGPYHWVTAPANWLFSVALHHANKGGLRYSFLECIYCYVWRVRLSVPVCMHMAWSSWGVGQLWRSGDSLQESVLSCRGLLGQASLARASPCRAILSCPLLPPLCPHPFFSSSFVESKSLPWSGVWCYRFSFFWKVPSSNPEVDCSGAQLDSRTAESQHGCGPFLQPVVIG